MKQTDYLIVGTGMAGLAAALKLSKKGQVALVTKSKLRQNNSYWAQGGVAAVMSDGDSFENHIEDTMKAGAHHNDLKAVKKLVQEAPRALEFLRECGVQFNEAPLKEGGHSAHRVWQTSDFTGQDIMNELLKAVQKNKSIKIYELMDVVDLIVYRRRCVGVWVREGNSEELSSFWARSVILATGGVGQLFEKTSNALAASGDALGMAIRAGVKLKDLEFVQFHPTALDFEDHHRYFLLSETLRGNGARVINEEGEYFLDECHPQAELAPRDLVTRGIYFESLAHSVFLDLSPIDPDVLQSTFPNILGRLMDYGFDPFSQKIPITPVAHFSCGGIQTDLKSKTSLKGLYALGEVACTGVHGANRLGSNALLEALVFSESLAENMDPLPELYMNADLEVPTVIIEDLDQAKAYAKRLARIMWEKVGIVRTPESLSEAAIEIQSIPARDYRVQSRQQVCLEIIKACQNRPESLGCHYMATDL